MNNKNKALTVFFNTSVQEIKHLSRSDYKWILIVKDNNILGVFDEKKLWREINLNSKKPSNMVNYINKSFKIYYNFKDIDMDEMQNYDYIIIKNDSEYECYLMDEALSIKLKEKINYLININEEIQNKFEYFKNSNIELTQILNSTYDEVFVTDATGHILFVSESSKKLTGLHPEFFIGKNIKEINEKGIIADSGTLKTIRTKETQTVEQKYPEGITVLATSQPIFNQAGNLHRIVTNSRDITELIEMKNKINKLTKNNNKQLDIGSAVFYYKGLITVDDNLLFIIDTVKRISVLDSSVFIDGETGVGKGLFAKMIHDLSPRSKKKFVQINCGAINSSLIESELFGYEPGSFTGASQKGKKGLVELASGGTLFLDEIGEMPLDLQIKLLQLLQEKTYMKLGGTKEMQADIRVISATNKNLKQLINENKFREDLFYRLHVIPLHLPPLRERKDDILILTDYFMYKYNDFHKKSVVLENDSKLILELYNFPGNIRELENLIEQIIATASNDNISKDDLPALLHNRKNDDLLDKSLTLKQSVDKTEKDMMIQALKKHNTTRSLAKSLGVSQTTIIRKLKKFNLNTL